MADLTSSKDEDGYTPAAHIIVDRNGFEISDRDNGAHPIPFALDGAEVLESYTVFSQTRKAFLAYQRLTSPRSSTDLDRRVQDALRRTAPRTDKCAVVLITLLGPRVFAAIGTRLMAQPSEPYNEACIIAPPPTDLTDFCQRSIALTRNAAVLFGIQHPQRPLSFSEFQSETLHLASEGYLNVVAKRGSFASALRLKPLCPVFGFSRGTPIDRYYLKRFVNIVRSEVTGRTLEIGGRRSNRYEYGLSQVTDYVTADIDPFSRADIIADVHRRDIFPNASFESVIAFNVLEHCERPWEVVYNVGGWLKPGGRFFCMVPSAQRAHAMPNDFWRPFPAGLRSICRNLAVVRMNVYGNLPSTIAALSGISAEEVGNALLDESDSRYPVATCLVAVRNE